MFYKLFLIITFQFISFSLHAQFLNANEKQPSISLGGITDFTPHGTQPFLSFSIEPSSDCGDCHGAFTPLESDKTYMPYSTWAGSMMANATRDPLFWAAVDIANQDIPGVGDFCIRCHTPSGFYAGHTKDGTGDMNYANGCELTGTVVSSESKLNDYQGVTCHFCHRQESKGPNNEPIILENSNVWLDDNVCDNPDSSNNFGPCRKGPYNPPLNVPHEWEYSEFINEGEFCGACHDVTSPEILNNGVITIAKTLIDENGVDTGIAMPIERTFSEWKNSLYSDSFFQDGFETNAIKTSVNTTCQDCHMPQATDSNARASTFNAAGARFGNLQIHTFAGGNNWIPEVLKNIYGAALSTSDFSRSDAFDRTIVSALDMLQNKSAAMELSLISDTPTQAEVNVKVTNLSGHKLPTGYLEGRRIWINLEVRDNANALIFESGAYNSSTAELTEVGTKIYESHQGQWDTNTNTCVFEESGNKKFHFVLNNCILKDNRIPPLGFLGGNDIELKPRGIIYPARPGFPNQLVNYDETQYTIPIPMGTQLPLTVTATLKFQVASKEYIEFLDNESTANAIPSENDLCNRTLTVGPSDQSRSAFMKTLWDNNGKSAPVDMKTSSLQITN
jgi:hypothetical protein